jgi:hypothetical protein
MRVLFCQRHQEQVKHLAFNCGRQSRRVFIRSERIALALEHIHLGCLAHMRTSP